MQGDATAVCRAMVGLCRAFDAPGASPLVLMSLCGPPRGGHWRLGFAWGRSRIGVRLPEWEQPWGQLWNNRAVVHRKRKPLLFIPFQGAVGAGGHPQACAWANALIRWGKSDLSTESSRLYYYHYVFIKEIKKKTGTTGTSRGTGFS